MTIKSINNFINGLNVLAKYHENGLAEELFFQAEHETIYTNISTAVLTPKSDDGQLLYSYGFNTGDDEVWIYDT